MRSPTWVPSKMVKFSCDLFSGTWVCFLRPFNSTGRRIICRDQNLESNHETPTFATQFPRQSLGINGCLTKSQTSFLRNISAEAYAPSSYSQLWMVHKKVTQDVLDFLVHKIRWILFGRNEKHVNVCTLMVLADTEY